MLTCQSLVFIGRFPNHVGCASSVELILGFVALRRGEGTAGSACPCHVRCHKRASLPLLLTAKDLRRASKLCIAELGSGASRILATVVCGISKIFPGFSRRPDAKCIDSAKLTKSVRRLFQQMHLSCLRRSRGTNFFCLSHHGPFGSMCSQLGSRLSG